MITSTRARHSTTQTTTKTKRFFCLPTVLTHRGEEMATLSKERQRKWLNAIHRSDINPASHRHVRVCSDHFITGQPSHLEDTGNPDWVPTRKLGYDTPRTFGSPDMRRHERMQNRRAKRTKLDMSEKESSSVDQGEIHCNEELGTGCQTDLSQRDIDALQQELEETKAHLSETERACQRLSLNESAFEGDDRKVLFHTGLQTWELLKILLQYIQPDLRNCRTVTPFQQLLMTLMRLRLGLRLEDLSFRFAVSRSTIHRILVDTINVLYAALADVIVWPDRDVLRATMPMDFVKHCPSCVVIFDCFEVFLERPTNLLARAQTPQH